MLFVKAAAITEEDYIVLEELDTFLFVEDFKSSQKILLKMFFNIDNVLDKKILFKNQSFNNFQEFFKTLF